MRCTCIAQYGSLPFSLNVAIVSPSNVVEDLIKQAIDVLMTLLTNPTSSITSKERADLDRTTTGTFRPGDVRLIVHSCSAMSLTGTTSICTTPNRGGGQMQRLKPIADTGKRLAGIVQAAIHQQQTEVPSPENPTTSSV